MLRFVKGVSIGCTFIIVLSATLLAAQTTSVQLVGNFNGISCEPDDPANDMICVGEHQWRKLKFINEPFEPDTIFFKFTREHSYLPLHWGWSGVEGIAKLDYNPPNIAAILPDSGYHYFNFHDTTYAYWLDRPNGDITACVSAGTSGSVPDGAYVSLLDSLYQVIGSYFDMTDSTALFEHLPPAPYYLTAGAPGFRDTMITNIVLGEDESIQFSIHLSSSVATAISSAFCERLQEGVFLKWTTSCCYDLVSFDVYRGTEPRLELMEKRTAEPVSGTDAFEFFDPVEDPAIGIYYYLVETESDDPTIHGPIFAPGIEIVIETLLGQNYPNPFNPATTIPYRVGTGEAGKPISISFFDVAGRRIDRYDLGAKPPGEYTFRWNPSISTGRSIPSGVYYCRLQIGKASFTGKLIILR
jgi:hypothetical protein